MPTMMLRSFLAIVTVVLVAVACSPGTTGATCGSGQLCICNDGTDQGIGCGSPVPDCTAACADHGGLDGGVLPDGG
jgi:hypothetical protein